VEAVKDGRYTWYRLAETRIAGALDHLLRLALVVDPDCCCGDDCRCA
jgi:hypothetical protein